MSNPLLQSVDIVRLNAENSENIAMLEKQCFSMPWSTQQLHYAFCQQHFFAYGLRLKVENNLLIGYISYYHVLDEMEILNIAILEQFRCAGLGQYLLTNTLQAATKIGISRAVLEVRPSNIAARKLYENIGFKLVGRRPKYYTDTAEDALVFSLNL